jgi:predicted transposase YdaD
MKKALFQPVSLIDVNQLDTTQLKQFPWRQPATGLMQHIRDEDITSTIINLLNQCIHLLNHPNGVDFLDYLLHYAVEAGNIIDVTEFYRMSEKVTEPVKEKVMTIADMLKKHGWEQGLAEDLEKDIEKGIEKGALANKQENAINMLTLGSDIEFVCKVTGLAAAEVTRLAEGITPKH